MRNWGIVFCIIIFILVGCNNKKEEMSIQGDTVFKEISNNIDNPINDKIINASIEQKDEKNDKIEIDYQKIKPNEVGDIMIVMYHGIKDLPPYHRKVEDFKKDLQYMYEHNYRLISMKDYIDNNIDLEPGMTPIILTFDDGLSTTFSLVDKDGKLVPESNTAIDIIEKFKKEHKDFGKAAIFYINGDLEIFKGAGTIEQRLRWLVDNGYEVSNHTSTHEKLSKLDADAIQKEIGKTHDLIKKILGNDYRMESLSYPFGIRPTEENLKYVKQGSYDSMIYNYKIGLREGPSRPFYSPIHIEFDPMNVARVRGSEGEVQDLWWFFKYYEDNLDKRYISDGDKDKISIKDTDEDKVNKELIKDKQLYIYSLE